MRKLTVLLLLAGFTLPACAAKDVTVEKVTVAQLEQALAAAHGKPDAEVAQQLSGLKLTERLSAARFARLNADLPGEKAKQALVILADSAAFLDPPAAEIPADAAPDPAAARQMLTGIVNYVNITVRQLPNLIAVRDTTGFEDKPQEDVQGPTGIATVAAMPLHSVGRSSVAVTYRDRQEVVDEKALKHGPKIGGFEVKGEFGPILSRVIADALQGKITWGRWEQGAGGKAAVFHYTVPTEKSHYLVQFCCVLDGYNSDGNPNMRIFSENAAYHGEIAFDPASGAILRITMEAELPEGELVSKAAMLVEYGPMEIAGKNYVCPTRSVSILLAHTAQQTGMYSKTNYKGSEKTYLNDVVFGQYRRFGSETRILTGDSLAPNMPSGPASADAPYTAPARATTH
ncbi:MAG: hypothetical protein ABSC88_01750 [Terracidiphilus sp.]|jgi:hypothetical protein